MTELNKENLLTIIMLDQSEQLALYKNKSSEQNIEQQNLKAQQQSYDQEYQQGKGYVYQHRSNNQQIENQGQSLSQNIEQHGQKGQQKQRQNNNRNRKIKKSRKNLNIAENQDLSEEDLSQNYQQHQLQNSQQTNNDAADDQMTIVTEKFRKLLRTKYGHFNKKVLLEKLYDKIVRKNQVDNQINDTINLEDSDNQNTQTLKTTSNIKNNENIQQKNVVRQTTSYDNNNKQVDQEQDEIKDQSQQIPTFSDQQIFQHTVKVFIEFGYGINIARMHARKGETIIPNPYNNAIAKILTKTWRFIQSKVKNMDHNMKIYILPTITLNQSRTLLQHYGTWMVDQYKFIFNKLLRLNAGLANDKIKNKQIFKLYLYLKDMMQNKSKLSMSHKYNKYAHNQQIDVDQSIRNTYKQKYLNNHSNNRKVNDRDFSQQKYSKKKDKYYSKNKYPNKNSYQQVNKHKHYQYDKYDSVKRHSHYN